VNKVRFSHYGWSGLFSRSAIQLIDVALSASGATVYVQDVTHASELTASSLIQLATGEIEYIHHPAFFSTSSCGRALPHIAAACDAASYTLTADLQSLGTSIGEATESAENQKRYLATAPATTRQIREHIFGELLSPGDLIKLSADELWPTGATLARYDGQNMLPSIIRRWTAGGHANPHIDQREIPLIEAYDLSMRIGVNIYLEVPPPGAGGELDFWGKYREEHAYRSIKRFDYGVDRESLGDPHYTLIPEQGDAIFFDAARMHGVRHVSTGSRVTAACFLGVRSVEFPLIVFA
jgi:hypothetical protein